MSENLSKRILEQSMALLDKSLEVTSPENLVKNSIKFINNKLSINDEEIKNYKKIHVIGFGKASLKMYQGFYEVLGYKNISRALLVTHITKSSYSYPKTKIIISSHPFISKKSEKAAKSIIKFVRNIATDDLLIVLVSGGGSAMLSLPIDELSLNEKINYISKILIAGIPEREANEIKKSLSKIKGGGISENAGCSQIVNLFLSDERNHQFDAIASGPSTQKKYIDPISFIKKYELEDITSVKIRNIFKKLSASNNKNYKSKKIKNFLIGSRENLLQTITDYSSDFNFSRVYFLKNLAEISTENAASYLSCEYKRIYKHAKKGMNLVVSSGEIQVPIVNPKTAKGGRNQHLAAMMMKNHQFNFPFVFIAYATDGMDFLEGVTGAYYADYHLNLIKEKQEYITQAIRKNQTYNLHHSFKTLLEGKKTGNNVSDIYLFSFFKD